MNCAGSMLGGGRIFGMCSTARAIECTPQQLCAACLCGADAARHRRSDLPARRSARAPAPRTSSALGRNPGIAERQEGGDQPRGVWRWSPHGQGNCTMADTAISHHGVMEPSDTAWVLSAAPLVMLMQLGFAMLAPRTGGAAVPSAQLKRKIGQ